MKNYKATFTVDNVREDYITFSSSDGSGDILIEAAYRYIKMKKGLSRASITNIKVFEIDVW